MPVFSDKFWNVHFAHAEGQGQLKKGGTSVGQSTFSITYLISL
jgi:hypothetical protein